MRRNELEQKIREEVNVPDNKIAEELWNIPVPRATEDAWFLKEIKKEKRRSEKRKTRWAAPAMVCTSFLLFAFCFMNYRMTSVIYLDAKPEIAVGINMFNKVVSVKAINEDGKKVLEGNKVRHQSVEEALDKIVTSMDEKGYFSESENAVLVSVKSKNEKNEEQVRIMASSEIKKSVDTMEGEHKIYEQTVSKDKKVNQIARQYQVTPGKATLLEKVVADHPEQNYETLAGLSIGELEVKMKEEGIHLEDYANVLEDSDEKKNSSPEEEKNLLSDESSSYSSDRERGKSHSSGGRKSEKKKDDMEEDTSEENTGEESTSEEGSSEEDTSEEDTSEENSVETNEITQEGSEDKNADKNTDINTDKNVNKNVDKNAGKNIDKKEDVVPEEKHEESKSRETVTDINSTSL